MRGHHVSACFVALALLTACSGGADDTESSVAESSGGEANVELPTECVLPEFTATVLRDGNKPAGSTAYKVVGAAVLPIALVPDRDKKLSLDEVSDRAESTDLVMYSMIFADEAIDLDGLSMFSSFEPSDGHTRGFVSIAPSSPDAPLAVGDVVTPGPATALNMFTSLSLVGMDFKSGPSELNAYLEQAQGQVEVVALTDDVLCLDIDLTWNYSDFGPDALGALTIRGVFAAPIADRDRFPFT